MKQGTKFSSWQGRLLLYVGTPLHIIPYRKNVTNNTSMILKFPETLTRFLEKAINIGVKAVKDQKYRIFIWFLQYVYNMQVVENSLSDRGVTTSYLAWIRPGEDHQNVCNLEFVSGISKVPQYSLVFRLYLVSMNIIRSLRVYYHTTYFLFLGYV